MTDDGRTRAARLMARSPYAMARAEALRLIEARHRRLLDAGTTFSESAEHGSGADFAAAEPMPVLDRPGDFAAEFWRTRQLPGLGDEPPKPSKSLSVPSQAKRRGRFKVIDGGASPDGDKAT